MNVMYWDYTHAELKKMADEAKATVEIYHPVNDNAIPTFHTDSLRFTAEAETIDDLPNPCKCYCTVMNKQEYAETVLANSSVDVDDIMEDDDKVLVILVPGNQE